MHVQGFTDRKAARKYATEMLKQRLIVHTLNKNSFSEQCYYKFGSSCVGGNSSGPTIEDSDDHTQNSLISDLNEMAITSNWP